MNRMVEEIAVGDVIVYRDIRVRVLRPIETQSDIFGRPLLRLWCRREDTGDEGFMSYGPGGVAQVVA